MQLDSVYCPNVLKDVKICKGSYSQTQVRMVVNADTVLMSYSMQGQGYLKTINLNSLSRSNAYKRRVFLPVVCIFEAPVTSTFPIR